jgi:hypothetical protein
MHDGLTVVGVFCPWINFVTRKVLKIKNEGWKTNKNVSWKSEVRTA